MQASLLLFISLFCYQKNKSLWDRYSTSVQNCTKKFDFRHFQTVEAGCEREVKAGKGECRSENKGKKKRKRKENKN